MNRKNFLSTILTLGAAGPVLAAAKTSKPPYTTHPATPVPTAMPAHPATPASLVTPAPRVVPTSPFPLIIPPYLKPGDSIGITCPAGNITLKEIQPAVSLIESWGFHIKVGDTVGKK